jgi:hypothetical protein
MMKQHAQVALIYLPPGPAGEKMGLDDFLAAKHTVADLLALATNELRLPAREEANGNRSGPYLETDAGLVLMKLTQGAEVPTPLTNFTARIAGQILRDDGAETERRFEIQAKLGECQFRFAIPSSSFNAMSWPLDHMGGAAIVHAGFGIRDQARAAIQTFSGEIQEWRVYTHTGWREIGGGWVYLHGGGAIGPHGVVNSVCVELSDSLGPFVLTVPPEGERLREAVRASLSILKVAPEAVTAPVFCAIYRAPMGPADFSLHISGQTGEGKTELAALAQQHFGAGFRARDLPGSWAGTGNANEMLAFLAKDALLVIDDFAPGGTATEVARTHREGDRVLRAQGNRSGRLRMRADGTLRPPKRPRGLILSTGEEVPRGESLQSRLLVLDFPVGGMDWGRLTECKLAAEEGLYAQAMAGYVQWLASRYAELGPGGGLLREVHQLRQAATHSAAHKRTPEIIANLAVGLRYYLAFAQEIGVFTADEARALWEQGWKALGHAAAAHSAHQAAANPADAFVRLLGAAIASGAAHLAGADGEAPELLAAAWGWRQEHGEWRPLGRLVGWVQGGDVYLEPDSAYAAANTLAQATGEAMSVAPRTLHKRLSGRRLLASEDAERGTHTMRKMLAGKRRDVLHLRQRLLLPRKETDQSDQTDQEGTEEPSLDDDSDVPGQFPWLSVSETDHAICPQEPSEGGKEEGAVSLVSLVSSSAQETRYRVAAVAAPVFATSGPPLKPCYTCGGARFWRDRYGEDHCTICHPPANESLVVEWAEAPS